MWCKYSTHMAWDKVRNCLSCFSAGNGEFEELAAAEVLIVYIVGRHNSGNGWWLFIFCFSFLNTSVHLHQFRCISIHQCLYSGAAGTALYRPLSVFSLRFFHHHLWKMICLAFSWMSSMCPWCYFHALLAFSDRRDDASSKHCYRWDVVNLIRKLCWQTDMLIACPSFPVRV